MKTILTSLLIALSLICCKPSAPPFPVLDDLTDSNGVKSPNSLNDSVYTWRSDKKENKSTRRYQLDSSLIPLKKIKQDFYIKYNILYNKKGEIMKGHIHFIIDSLNLIVGDNSFLIDSTRKNLEHIENNDNYGSYSSFSYVAYIESGSPFQYLYVDKNGNIVEYAYGSIAFGNYQDKKIKYKFKKGSGHWIDYYPIYHDNTESMSFSIKEEGEIKRNFKYGEWKYYNKNGVIDSTKTYILKDSVDVRFPHCIFNKKEPCFCEKK
jgi:hypothetical protein